MVKAKINNDDIIGATSLQVNHDRKIIRSDVPIHQIKEIILKVLDDSKAEEISVIDLEGKSDIAEMMIIATGRSDRHIKSTAEHVCDALKAEKISYAVEGLEHRNWVLIDTASVLLHIFNKDNRELYNLEDLWG